MDEKIKKIIRENEDTIKKNNWIIEQGEKEIRRIDREKIRIELELDKLL